MIIFTDPHIGRRAGAHTTQQSSKALDLAIYDHAMRATCQVSKYESVICVGDLFDKSHNKEVDLLRGLSVAQKCDLILAGNHDLSNRDNTKTSIEVVEEVHGNLCRAEVSEVLFEDYDDDDCETGFTIIPHHSSQDLFDKAIDLVCTNTEEGEVGKRDIIFLHANFNNPFAQNDASLNLSPEQASKLLESFKYIVMGHEHSHRWEMGGKLLICGNTHPTSFGDISDKFAWRYTSEAGFTKTQLWSTDEKFLRVTVPQLLEGFPYAEHNFIEVFGEEVDPELAPSIAHALKSVWESGSEQLFMVRNNVKYKQLATTVVDESVQLENVTQAITKDLEDTDLLELWQEHLGAAEND